MAFDVDWPEELRQALAAIWLAYADKPAVTAAQDTVDRFLGTDPKRYGQHVAEGLWRFHVPPLLVHFTIDDTARRVDVTNLHVLPLRT